MQMVERESLNTYVNMRFPFIWMAKAKPHTHTIRLPVRSARYFASQSVYRPLHMLTFLCLFIFWFSDAFELNEFVSSSFSEFIHLYLFVSSAHRTSNPSYSAVCVSSALSSAIRFDAFQFLNQFIAEYWLWMNWGAYWMFHDVLVMPERTWFSSNRCIVAAKWAARFKILR